MCYQERTARANITTWERSEAYDLGQVYGRYSTEKGRAWRYCQDLCRKHDGERLRVINHNTFKFTAGFQFADPETGVLRFMYITPSYDVAVDM